MATENYNSLQRNTALYSYIDIINVGASCRLIPPART